VGRGADCRGGRERGEGALLGEGESVRAMVFVVRLKDVYS
jgi:hypothetical protein